MAMGFKNVPDVLCAADVMTTKLVKLHPEQDVFHACLLYTSPSPRDKRQSRMPSSA